MIKAALIVQNCIPGQFKSNLKATLNWISLAAQKKADLILFPEMNLTGYTVSEAVPKFAKPLDDHLKKILINESRKWEVLIGVGLAENDENGKIYASHCIFFPDGSHRIYRKTHLSPFEQKWYAAGNEIEVYHFKNFKFGIQLCYDAHFPELSLKMARAGADILFIPHASPRGSSAEKLSSWLRHLQARAFDNGLYVAAWNQMGDNRNGLEFPGICVAIGPDGKPFYQSTENQEQLHMIEFHHTAIEHVRSHQMRYFLPNRRDDLFDT